jgi:TorA maturation chaperone TorD
LLLHAALLRSSDETRTGMLRAMSHMGMTFGDQVLAPDHLAIACEVAAVALAQKEPVVMGSLPDGYLIPWCGTVRPQLDDDDTRLRRVVEQFLSDCERTSEVISERTGPPMHISKTNACSAQNRQFSR